MKTTLEQQLAEAVAEEIARVAVPIHQRLSAIEARLPHIAAVKALRAEYENALALLSNLRDAGVWNDVTAFKMNNLTSFKGSLWICRRDNRGVRPGTDDSWRLCVRAGKDGRDGKDANHE